MTQRKRLPEIDAMYFLGTILVVLGHSHSSDWSTFDGTFFCDLIVFIYRFHMPAFFAVAGFLFLRSGSFEKLGFRRWITGKAVKLMVPYVVLSLPVLLPKYVLEHHGLTGITRHLVEVVFAPRLSVWGHFWFLPVLLMCDILFGLWRRAFFRENSPRALAAAAAVSAGIYFLPIRTDWFALADLKSALVFFAAGMVAGNLAQEKSIAARPAVRRVMELLTALAVSVGLHLRFGGSQALMLLVALLMIDAMWQLSCLMGSSRAVSWISRHNFTIYLYSWPAQAAVMVLCNVLKLSWSQTSLAMFAAGIGVPSLLAWGYERVNWIHNRFFDLVLGVK